MPEPSWFFPEFSTDPARRAAKHRLADAVRGLIEDVALLDPARADMAVVAEVTRLVATARDALAPAPRLRLDPSEGGADTMAPERGPVVGVANAAAAPLRLEATDDGARGWSRYGAVFDGGADAVHGGVVASAFTDVLACAHFATAASWGHIGTMTVRYRAAAPVGRRMDYEAVVQRIDGRKSTYAGAVRAGDVLVAEADAVFIAPRTG